MSDSPRLGGKSALLVFVLVLVAYVVESQLAQYIQATLKYRQPYFLFYAAHSSFWIIFPLHVAYLSLTTGRPVKDYMRGLSLAIKRHVAGSFKGSEDIKFPWPRFATMLGLMTVGVTLPALLWFCAVSLAPLTDVTAIWNANAFFAYMIAVKMFKLPWDRKRMFAVVLATGGVMAVIYGGTSIQEEKNKQPVVSRAVPTATAPLLGDLLTLVGSIGYGLYQVLYKKHIALPSDPGREESSQSSYAPILRASFDDASDLDPPDEDLALDPQSISDTMVFPPPFGLHPNLLTSLVGVLTLLLLWIPLPVLHYMGAEPFHWPANWHVALVILGIALSGVVYNAGFMILLGVWGPIIASIGNLMTTVFTFASDVVFGAGLEVVTFWNFMGSVAIVAAFGILVEDLIVNR
ncbi:hypothetical protein BJ322DRAFT_1107239 [Thelephora terrestris]|uniref:EamA domain-containing protein n=1 Tax=Thelephora terrestris TaxID=56493 RepID=A0A9P6HHA1_9AGAM|nr:hypothetical protein BJ322DRAFT_1107239 [Thelephora terrestris]